MNDYYETIEADATFTEEGNLVHETLVLRKSNQEDGDEVAVFRCEIRDGKIMEEENLFVMNRTDLRKLCLRILQIWDFPMTAMKATKDPRA